MAIHEIAPSADLARDVDAYWRSDDSPAAGPVRVLPDGCADIVFPPEGGAVIVGTMTRPLTVNSADSAGLFGIRFRPGRAAHVLRAPLTMFTDARVPLEDVRKAFPKIQRIGDVESALRRLLSDARADARVDAAVEAIVRSGGRVSIENVAAVAGVSRQHLARSFAYHVGLSPKTFARVVRFRRALALARRGPDR